MINPVRGKTELSSYASVVNITKFSYENSIKEYAAKKSVEKKQCSGMALSAAPGPQGDTPIPDTSPIL